MGLRPGYKQTEVGMIPAHWEVIPTGEAGHVIGGRQRSPHHVGPLCKYLRVANVFDGFLETEDVLEMPFSTAEKERFLLRGGDVLLNEGQSIELVGRSAIYRGLPAECCFQNTLIRFRANRNTNVEFAQFVFQRYLARGVFASIALQTTSIAHLGAGRFAALKMPLPPLPEQKAIAGALSDTDALSESLEQLIAKKRHIKQGAMQELLRPKDEWVPTKLGSLGVFLKGSGIRKDESMTGNLPCIRYGEIYTKHNDYIRTFHSRISSEVAATARRLRTRDLLFAGSGETKEEIGKCVAFVHEIEAYAGGDIVILRPANSDSMFLGYYLNTASINKQKASRGQGDAVVHIGSAALSDIDLTLPAVEEQTAIATVLSDMDAEIAALEAKLAKARQIKQGMMHNLLTGRIRLV